MLGKVQTYWFCTFERCDSICFIYPVLCFFLIARLRLDLHLMKLRKWCHCKFYPYPYLWLQTNVLEKGLSHTGIFASRWPALPSVPACCNSKFTHICISSKRKNLNVTVFGVLVQALFAFKWPVLPKNPFLQAAIRSPLQGKEKICSCCTLIFPLGVLAEGLLQRPFCPFEWLELPRRCKICISEARTH